MHVFILIQVATILVIEVGGVCLPWFLTFLSDRVLFIFAPGIVMMIIVPMSGAVVGDLVPLLAGAVFLFNSYVGDASYCGSTSIGWGRSSM